jgi:hypothetical protein
MRKNLIENAWIRIVIYCLLVTIINYSKTFGNTIIPSTASIGDLVWEDSDLNGLQDPHEEGIDGIELILLDSLQNIIGRTVTDANGFYAFNNLNSGKYYIQLGSHGEYKPTFPSYKDMDRNSDIDVLFKKTGTIFLAEGQVISNIDIGLYVTKYDDFGQSSIGDKVWEDINRNGLQDVNEPGIAGIELILYNKSKHELSRSVTDENGHYLFSNLDSGAYYIQLVPQESYEPTQLILSQGQLNSDIDLLFLKTSTIFLDGTNSRDDIDVGLYRNAEIRGLIWNDENSNCTKDQEETYAKKVKIELLNTDLSIEKVTYSFDDGSFGIGLIQPGFYFLRLVNIDNVQLCWEDQSGFVIFNQSTPDMIIGPFEIKSNGVIDDLIFGIQPRQDCDWGIEIVETQLPNCKGQGGFVQIDMTDPTRNYTIEWTTGSDQNLISDLSEGIYTVYVTDGSGCSNSVSISLFKSDEICDDRKESVKLDIFVNLEGAYDQQKGMMKNVMRERGYLPGLKPKTIFGKMSPAGHPYSQYPWFYQGLEGDESSDFEKFYPLTTIDWVLVSLRTDVNVSSEVYRRAGLLQSDGSIMFIDGFDEAVIDVHEDYYVVIEHRNHIMVMSPIPMPVYNNTVSFDFRNQQSFTGLLGHGQKLMPNGAFAMYAGNIDHVGYGHSDLNYSDLRQFFINNGLHSSYYLSDIDLNGDINVNDRKMLLDNMGVFSTVSH